MWWRGRRGGSRPSEEQASGPAGRTPDADPGVVIAERNHNVEGEDGTPLPEYNICNVMAVQEGAGPADDGAPPLQELEIPPEGSPARGHQIQNWQHLGVSSLDAHRDWLGAHLMGRVAPPEESAAGSDDTAWDGDAGQNRGGGLLRRRPSGWSRRGSRGHGSDSVPDSVASLASRDAPRRACAPQVIHLDMVNVEADGGYGQGGPVAEPGGWEPEDEDDGWDVSHDASA